MGSPTDRLLSQLQQTQIQQKDNPLYQVIKQLIQRVKELENLLRGGSTTNNIINLQQIIQYLTSGDGGGGDGEIGPPGIRGADGSIGPPGPAGAITLGPMGLDGDQGEDAFPIPGPIGPQGVAGATGAAGSQAIGFVLYEEGPEGDIGPVGPIGPASNGWELLATQVAAGAVQYDFSNLGSYSEILVLLRSVTLSSTGVCVLRVSTDNGATFLAASGDYVQISGLGVATNDTFLPFYVTNATAARNGFSLIEAFNINNVVKPAHANFFSTDGIGFRFATNTSPYNAVRVLNTGAGNISGGTIYVLGRR